MEQESAPRRRHIVLGAVLGSAAVAAVGATIRPGASPASLRSSGAQLATIDTHNDTKKFDFCAEQVRQPPRTARRGSGAEGAAANAAGGADA